MTKKIQTTLLAVAFLSAALATTVAQTTATWTGGASDGLWNTAGNWDVGVPGEGTNAIVGQTTVNYNAAMAATSFAGLTLGGALNVNAGGFTIDAASAVPLTINTNGVLTINSAGVVVITNSGSVTMLTPTTGASPVIDVEGGALVLSNNFGSFNLGDSTSKDANIGAVFTNNGGHVVIDQQLVVKGRDSRFYMSGGTLDLQGGLNLNVVNNDMRQFFTIAGGTANLGDVNINRATTAGGLSVEGGAVNSSSIQIGTGIASGNARMTGGIWTNSGAFYVANRNNAATSSNRRVYFTMNDGYLVTLGADGIIINNQGEASTSNLSNNGGTLTVNGGTITTEGIYLNGPSVTANSYARFALSGGTLYLGTVGLVANADSANSLSAVFTLSGGTLAAKDDWTSSANLPLSGALTFQAADAGGIAHNITLNGVISGSTGSLIKTGAGTLTLNGTNTYTASTVINNGTLALGVNGALPSSSISVASGATFDVTASGLVLGSSQAIGGSGIVAGPFGANDSTINPGGSTAEGTLTFANGLALTNTILNFQLTDDTTGMVKSNDALNVVGDLAADQLNTIVVTPVGSLSIGTYTLIKYSGTFNGSITNFACVAGTLTNAPGEIDLVVSVARPTANLVWVGDGTANLWDTGGSSNWLNGSSLDRFYTGDTNNFTDLSTNATVDISGIVAPAAVQVDSTNDYTFTGDGDITGTAGLTKSNSGRLIILNTNDYTGVTTISGGTLSVSNLTDGGVSGPLGAALGDSTKLVFDGGTLEYLGGDLTFSRGATFAAGGGTLNVPFSNLTISGALTGEGVLSKSGAGQLVLPTANNYAGGTVISSGSVRAAQGSGATISALGTGALTLNGTSNSAAFLFGGDQETLNNTLNVTGNLNYITNNGNNTISGVTGSGTVTFEGASANTMTLQKADMSGFTGTFVVDTVGVLRFYTGSTADASGATFDLGSGSALLNNKNGNLTARIGALKGGPNTTLQGASSADNPTTYIIGGKNIDSTFSGSINELTSARIVNVVKTGTGTLLLLGGAVTNISTPDGFTFYTNVIYTNLLTYTGSTTISNGVLKVVVPDALTNGTTPVILAASTAVLDASDMGYISNQYDTDGVTVTNQILITNGVFEVASGQMLGGLGTIRASKVLLDVGSILNVGLPTGVLAVTNDLEMAGAVNISLSRGNTPSSGKLMAQSFAIDSTATLVITNTGAALADGDHFTLFNKAVNSNLFASVTLPATDPTGTTNYVWQNDLAVDGTITLVSGGVSPINQNPPPIFTSFNGSTLSLSWPTNSGWILQMQTNSLSSGLSTNWVDVLGSQDMTSTNITVNANQPTVFYRLRLP